MRVPIPPSLVVAAVVAASVCMSATTTSAAAILDVIGGELVGARDVQVGGTLYNVRFDDSTCVNAFDGCDAVSDFPFDNFEDALDAAQALLDQVFIDGPAGLFDTEPFAITGCSSGFLCRAFIPYDVDGVGLFSVPSAFAQNHIDEAMDGPFTLVGIAPAQIFSDLDNAVLAVFSPARTMDVPAPGTLWLFGVGLAGLAVARRQRRPARPQSMSSAAM